MIKHLVFSILIFLSFINISYAQSIKFGDIVINEILFNPETRGARFIELYNRTDKEVQLSSLSIADFKKNIIKNIESNFIIKPKSFLVLTDDVSYILKRYTYNDSKVIVKSKLPAWSADSGNASIFIQQSNKKVIIDSFDYSKKMHNPILADIEGVSLERVNPDIETNNVDNWQSASSVFGYATPGLKNSQFQQDPSVNNTNDSFFTLVDKVFSPFDKLGKDYLTINFNLGAENYISNILVFDINGHLTKKLVQQEILPREGSIKWYGDTDENQPALYGTYIIYFELLDTKGQMKRQKAVCIWTDKI